MNVNVINLIPSKITKGLITQKEAINKIVSFVCKNYPIFGLHRYDEDFREEIILSILEKGTSMLIHYNQKLGTFFNYMYSFINSLVRTKNRTAARAFIKDSIILSETIKELDEKEYKYNHIDYNNIDSPKIPYAKYNTTTEELRNIFSNISKDKGILIVAMKTVFYLTDLQVNYVASYYNLKKQDLYKAIQYFRKLLMPKYDKKKILQDRRAAAYYKCKKYEKQIELIEKSDNLSDKSILKNYVIQKNKQQYATWKQLNEKLKNGLLTVKPSNKLIASVLGICERQVIYHLKRTKEKEENKNTNKKEDFNTCI